MVRFIPVADIGPLFRIADVSITAAQPIQSPPGAE